VLAATDPRRGGARCPLDRQLALEDQGTHRGREGAGATDPDRAERLAYAVTDEVWRPQALAVIAVVLAGYHPVGPQISLTEVIGNLL
jgi:hypothetical protein